MRVLIVGGTGIIGISAADTARAYQAALEGNDNGATLSASDYTEPDHPLSLEMKNQIGQDKHD